MKKLLLLLTIMMSVQAPVFADSTCQEAVDTFIATYRQVKSAFQNGRAHEVDIQALSSYINSEMDKCSPARAAQFVEAFGELQSMTE